MRLIYLFVFVELLSGCSGQVNNEKHNSFKELYALSQTYRDNMEHEKCIETLHEAKMYARDSNDSNNVNVSFFDSYFSTGQYQLAKDCLPLYKDLNNNSFWNLYTNTSFYYRFEKYDKAIESAENSIKAIEEIPEKERDTFKKELRHLIINSYSILGNDKELLKYLKMWENDMDNMEVYFRGRVSTVREALATLEQEVVYQN